MASTPRFSWSFGHYDRCPRALRVEQMLFCKATYTQVDEWTSTIHPKAEQTLRVFVEWCAAGKGQPTAEVAYVAWHDDVTGLETCLYAREGGLLDGMDKECAALLDMTLEQVFRCDDAWFKGHVEIRYWKGERWGSEGERK